MSLVAGPTLENCSNDRIFYGISIETERGNHVFSANFAFYNSRPTYNFQHSFNAPFLSPLHFFFFPSFSFFFLEENEIKARRETLSWIKMRIFRCILSLSLQGDKLVSPRR